MLSKNYKELYILTNTKKLLLDYIVSSLKPNKWNRNREYYENE